MAEENNASFPQARDGGSRGGRQGGNREGGGQRDGGGFRIRMSDNELRAVKAIQDAFNLRSPVAALGFSVRTVAQLLEDGQLDALVAEQRANGGGRPEGRRDGRRGEGRPERGGAGGGAARVNPFARPQKPVAATPAPAAAEEPVAADAGAEAEAGTAAEPAVADDAAAVPEAAATETGSEA